ncbi:MAG: hypothetical protein P4M15_08950 [Alphaproteobacteria bacterium]|nr:hypothetical protein [Alphaproteobacteria bacterium]
MFVVFKHGRKIGALPVNIPQDSPNFFTAIDGLAEYHLNTENFTDWMLVSAETRRQAIQDAINSPFSQPNLLPPQFRGTIEKFPRPAPV